MLEATGDEEDGSKPLVGLFVKPPNLALRDREDHTPSWSWPGPPSLPPLRERRLP